MNFRRQVLLPAGVFFLALFTAQCTRQAVQTAAPSPQAIAEEPQKTVVEPCAPAPVEKSGLALIIEAYSEIRSADISGEIESLLPLTRKSAVSGRRDPKIAHLQLAWLYGHYRNPTPQYQRALQELDAYLASDPYSRDDLLLVWQRLLRELTAAGREVRELKDGVEKMKGQLEQLQHLDIEMEKSRKQMK